MSVYYAQHEAIKRFYAYYQGEDDSIATHLKNFKTMIAVVEHYGGDIFYGQSLIKHERDNDKKNCISSKSKKELKQLVRDRKMAMAFLLSANKKTYGSLLDKLSDSYSFKLDAYPKTLNSAYGLLIRHAGSQKSFQKSKEKKHKTKQMNTSTSTPKQSDQYPTIDEEEQHHNIHESATDSDQEVDNQIIQHIQETGFTSESDDESVIFSFIHAMNSDIAGQEVEKDTKPLTDILLDTGFTCSVFNNEKMLINVRKAKRKLVVNMNGGPHISNMEGELPGFFTVWFNPRSMINILSFADVRKRFRVTIDTEKQSCFLVHTGKSKPLHFNEVGS